MKNYGKTGMNFFNNSKQIRLKLKQEIKQNNFQNSSSKTAFSSSEYQAPQLFNMEESEEIIKRCYNKIDDVNFNDSIYENCLVDETRR